MRLLLDECAGGRRLAKKLEAAGHDVARSVDAIGDGVEDLVVFTFAQDEHRVVLTFNNRDFEEIAEDRPGHAGLILIYQDNDGRDMSDDDIVNAVVNVEKTFADGTVGQIIVLNGYRW
jgi:predicted nuclease of predicted toxin-antitoxin system